MFDALDALDTFLIKEVGGSAYAPSIRRIWPDYQSYRQHFLFRTIIISLCILPFVLDVS